MYIYIVPYIYAASITSSQTVAVIGGVVAVVFIITAALIIVIAIVVLRYRRERYTIFLMTTSHYTFAQIALTPISQRFSQYLDPLHCDHL